MLRFTLPLLLSGMLLVGCQTAEDAGTQSGSIMHQGGATDTANLPNISEPSVQGATPAPGQQPHAQQQNGNAEQAWGHQHGAGGNPNDADGNAQESSGTNPY